MDIVSREFSFPDPASQRKVHAVTASAGEPERGWVLVFHGLGDHIGRHDWVRDLLLEEGYGFIGFDWPGCGQSEGVRGDLPLIDEGGRLVDELLSLCDGEVVGALGHSTGAFYLARFLAEKPERFPSLRWAWFSSSLIHPDAGQGAIKIAVAKTLAKWFPRMTLSTGVSRGDCYHTGPSENPDSLPKGVHDRVSLRFGSELLQRARDIDDIVPGMSQSLAYLVTHGLSDDVCPVPFAEDFYRALPLGHRTFLAVSGARHEPFREPNRGTFLSALRCWLRRR